MTTPLKPLTHWIERAAQLWCLPKHQKKVMDSDLAFSIAELCLDAYNEGRRSPDSEARAKAFEEAADRAQIEVNACEHHARASKGAIKTMHLAARGVAYDIMSWCRENASAARSLDGAGKEGK